MLAFLASLTGPQCEEMFLVAGRNRRRASGKGWGRRGNPKDAGGKTMECDICHSTHPVSYTHLTLPTILLV
eukprot:6060307-Pyramimonas_sp.AAC.1